MKRQSRGRATSVHGTMKYHKVETKETQTEQSEEGEIVDPIQRIFDHLNIFPCDLDRMVFEYWPGIHSPEKIWNIFEDFCDKRFTNLLLEFQKGELESRLEFSDYEKLFLTPCSKSLKKNLRIYYPNTILLIF